MIKIKERQDQHVTLEASGTIQREDYDEIIPQLEKVIADHGKVRALIEFNEFSGWSPSALVHELQFDLKHRNDVERCAVLGETKTQEWMAKMASPLFSGEVRFFPKSEIQQAKAWLHAS